MKEIVIISGKGGTGKTSISASLGLLGGKDIVIGDCDVDAADLHLLLAPDFAYKEDFYSGQLAEIQIKDCSSCGLCSDVCRFDAITQTRSGYMITELDCEGCGYCARVCPDKAIVMKERLAGEFYISQTRIGNAMVHAKLGIGADNSGKLVAKVKKEAKRIALENEKQYVIIDGAPGVGCPVISSLSGANFVVFVTEPTSSGLHDLKRVFELVKKFGINSGCVINKYDINLDMTERIEEFLNNENIIHLCNLPYDENFTKAMTMGKTIIEYDNGILSEQIKETWTKLKLLLS